MRRESAQNQDPVLATSFTHWYSMPNSHISRFKKETADYKNAIISISLSFFTNRIKARRRRKKRQKKKEEEKRQKTSGKKRKKNKWKQEKEKKKKKKKELCSTMVLLITQDIVKNTAICLLLSPARDAMISRRVRSLFVPSATFRRPSLLNSSDTRQFAWARQSVNGDAQNLGSRKAYPSTERLVRDPVSRRKPRPTCTMVLFQPVG